ncbi:MAG: DUF374 domain-containing protein [Vampirovibrionales bacterium]|nr:DUF374 domain-containing protein [Vampirovibrionales bacterium]
MSRSMKDTWRLFRRVCFRKAMVCLGTPLVASAASTWRLSTLDIHPESEALIHAGQPLIFAMWHGRMFGMLKLPVARKNLCVLISASNDGHAITEVVRRLGFGGVVSRASYKNGSGAMRHFLEQLQNGYHAVITVDGPRGPIYQVKPGVIWMSQKAQIPIIPVSASCAAPILKFPKAWDKFHAPNYFSPIKIALGAPILPSNDALCETSTAQQANVLRQALMDLTKTVDSSHAWVETLENQHHDMTHGK